MTCFGHHEEKLETFAKSCVAASLETLHKGPTIPTTGLFGNYSAKSLEPLLEYCLLKYNYLMQFVAIVNAVCLCNICT